MNLEDAKIPTQALKQPLTWVKLAIGGFVTIIFLLTALFFGYTFFHKQTTKIASFSTNVTPSPAPTPTPDITADWHIYKSTQYTYQIKYPKGIEKNLCGIAGITIADINDLTLSPQLTTACTDYVIGILIDEKTTSTVDTKIAEYIQFQASSYGVSNESITALDYPLSEGLAKKIYNASNSNEVLYIVSHPQRKYILTIVTQDPNQQNQLVLDTIVQSFHFTDLPSPTPLKISPKPTQKLQKKPNQPTATQKKSTPTPKPQPKAARPLDETPIVKATPTPKPQVILAESCRLKLTLPYDWQAQPQLATAQQPNESLCLSLTGKEYQVVNNIREGMYMTITHVTTTPSVNDFITAQEKEFEPQNPVVNKQEVTVGAYKGLYYGHIAYDATGNFIFAKNNLLFRVSWPLKYNVQYRKEIEAVIQSLHFS